MDLFQQGEKAGNGGLRGGGGGGNIKTTPNVSNGSWAYF